MVPPKDHLLKKGLGVYYISPPLTRISFKVSLSNETNNFFELMTPKLVLMLARENGVSQIQIYEDSMLVI
jgi:ribonuclease HI